MTKTREEFWEKLEELGEEVVRPDYEQGIYGGRNKKWVGAWLEKKEIERERRKENLQADSLKTAKSSNDASWMAANEAKEANQYAKKANKIAKIANKISESANKIAWAALAVAIIAAIFSVLAIFISLGWFTP